jgi:hypothetical protein
MEKKEFRKARNSRRRTGRGTEQQSGIRTACTRKESTFLDIVDQLKEINQAVVLNQQKAGRIIHDHLGDAKRPLREEKLRKLCEAVGISRSTAYEWMQACRDFEKLLEPVVAKAKETFGKKITKPIRKKLLEVQAANPCATPEKIVELTESELKQKPKPAVEKDGPTAKERHEKLFDFAENLYRNVDPQTRERELRSLVNDLLTYFSVPEKEVA